MKLLYCEECGDIIAPYRQALRLRWCECARHGVWWLDPQRGILRAHDRFGRDGWPNRATAYILGITNLLLYMEGQMSKEKVAAAIAEHDDSYLFKQWESLIVRFRPGESGDTRWSGLPGEG